MNHRTAEILIVLVTILGALGSLFSKCALDEFQPYTFLAIRFFMATAILMTLCWPQAFRLAAKEITQCLFSGAFLGFGLMLWIIGLQHTANIGEGAFIVSLNVVVATVMARFLFAEPVSKRIIIALVPAVLGLALLSLGVDIKTDQSQLFFLASLIGFSLHLNLTRKYAPHISALPLTCWQMLATGSVSLIGAFVMELEEKPELWLQKITLTGWSWVFASVILATSLRFAIQTKALQTLSASQASLISILEPVWVTILGAVFLAETMKTNQLLGCSLIFFSLVIYRGDQIKEVLFGARVSYRS